MVAYRGANESLPIIPVLLITMDRIEKAYDFLLESVKQLMALATGVIALTITFGKDFLIGVDKQSQGIALWAWGALLFSIFFGLWCMFAMAGTLASHNVSDEKTSPYRFNIEFPFGCQIVTFLIGMVLTVSFAVTAYTDNRPLPSSTPAVQTNKPPPQR